ncbi:MAG: ABC transporter permease [Betaproteobacteria bacterium]|jgi:phospholipid/cholesterol/gamma-HCH transport system permease protein
MNALYIWLNLRGQAFSERLNGWAKVFRFALTALVGVMSPSMYNKATRLIVQKQIYFTAWQILPGFALFAALFSFLIIEIVGTTAAKYGLYEYALELIVRILVLEILPLMTVLFIALRTGAAINTEVALMKIQHELDALQRMGIDPMRLELLPRVIGGTISVLALTAVNIVIALWLTHLLIIDFHPWSLTPSDFTRMIGRVLDIPALVVLWLKTLAFGFAVTVIPIAEGLSTPQKLFYAPIAVLRGMVRLFFALMVIEAAALAIVYV